jgi:hypothetical protein
MTSGLGSPMVEIMADTAVALASANVQLVAKKVIGRLCRVRWWYFCYDVPFRITEFKLYVTDVFLMVNHVDVKMVIMCK